MTTFQALPNREVKTSSRAVWSLVLGILSMTCLWLLGSVPAIILGILALKTIENSGGAVKGRGLGIAGIVTGSVGIFVGLAPIAMIAAIAIPAFSGFQQKAQSTKQMSDIRQLIYACKAYAADNNGAFPESLPILITDGYLDSKELLYWKASPSADEAEPHLYCPGLTDTAQGGEAPIAAAQPILGKRTVGYADGSVTALPEEGFQATLATSFE
jgi:hypothetical protein